MSNQDIARYALYTILTIGAVILFLTWSHKQDERRQAVYSAYEECVEREYGRLPAHIYLETGEYPECR